MKVKLMVSGVMCFMLFSICSYGQNDKDVISAIDKKHEVRLGVAKLLIGGVFEGVYEYIPDNNRGFGAAVLVNFDSDNEYLENYSITPFYRMYFQTKEDYGAKGFFVEGFVSFFSGNQEVYEDVIYSPDLGPVFKEKENFFDICAGLALGKKWINTGGFVFEIKVGGGRNLLNTSKFQGLFKGDFYIGYRF